MTDCPRCLGEGEVPVNPSWSGDPQGETSELCRACGGTGIQRSRKEPSHVQVQGDDDRTHPVSPDVAACLGGSPLVLERQPLALTHVRALTTGLILGSALSALTVLLVIEVS